jgi:hypothetical protein
MTAAMDLVDIVAKSVLAGRIIVREQQRARAQGRSLKN